MLQCLLWETCKDFSIFIYFFLPVLKLKFFFFVCLFFLKKKQKWTNMLFAALRFPLPCYQALFFWYRKQIKLQHSTFHDVSLCLLQFSLISAVIDFIFFWSLYCQTFHFFFPKNICEMFLTANFLSDMISNLPLFAFVYESFLICWWCWCQSLILSVVSELLS